MNGWLWAIVGYVALVTTFAFCWAAARAYGRANEREHKALQYQIEAVECARLLREIAVQSYMQQHIGTFHAWSEHMGSLHIQVQSLMHPFEDDAKTE